MKPHPPADPTPGQHAPAPPASDDLPGNCNAIRFDRGVMHEPMRTPEGYLRVEADLARTGVLKYQTANGTRTELVLETTLADEDSLASFEAKAVTMEHPIEGGRLTLLNPRNVRRFTKGNLVGAPYFDAVDGKQRGILLITDAEALAAVEDGLREISLGYAVELDETPGVHPVFGAYDAIQTRRVGNHVAITKAARGGPDLRLRMDSGMEIAPDAATGDTMDKEMLEALIAAGADRAKAETIARDLDAARADSQTLQGRADAAEAQVAELTADRDALQTRVDALAEEIEALKAQPEPRMDHAALLAWHTERTGLEAAAAAAEIADVQEMDNDAIRQAVVTARLDSVPEDADVAYFRAAYDILSAQKPAEPAPDPKAAPRADTKTTPVTSTDPRRGAERKPGKTWADAMARQFKAHRQMEG